MTEHIARSVNALNPSAPTQRKRKSALYVATGTGWFLEAVKILLLAGISGVNEACCR